MTPTEDLLARLLLTPVTLQEPPSSQQFTSKAVSLVVKIDEDRIDIAVKVFGVLGGIISIVLAFLAIIEFSNSTNHCC